MGRGWASKLSGMSSREDTGPIEIRDSLVTLFNLNYFFRDLISKYSHTRGWGRNGQTITTASEFRNYSFGLFYPSIMFCARDV